MAEHPARPRGNRSEIESVEPSCIDRARQFQFEDQFLGVGMDPGRLESTARIQPTRRPIIRRNQQSHPAATNDPPQPRQHRLQCDTAIAAALDCLVQCKPAQPPAGRVPQFGMHNEEPGDVLTDLDGNH